MIPQLGFALGVLTYVCKGNAGPGSRSFPELGFPAEEPDSPERFPARPRLPLGSARYISGVFVCFLHILHIRNLFHQEC